MRPPAGSVKSEAVREKGIGLVILHGEPDTDSNCGDKESGDGDALHT